MKLSFSRGLLLILALAGSAYISGAQAAVSLNESFDGAWFNAATSGRGVLVDVIPTGPGTNTFFAATFTYDTTGAPLWIIVQADNLKETEFGRTNVPVLKFSGGTFGNTFTPPTNVQIGTATLTVNSCNSIKIDIAPNQASGLPAVNMDLVRLGGNAPADVCAVQRTFTACPAGTTAAAARTCRLSGTITSNLTLTNETTWVLSGLVKVGNDNANSATLTIEPGTRITGEGATSDYLYVNPGSKIIAEGTPRQPIIFTSPKDGVPGQTPAPKDWGGIVISGNAPNNKCPTTPFDCRSEFDPTLRYGGSNAHENSGVLSYVQVRYSGYIFTPGREVNSFTFQSVGDGTRIDHIQSYRGGDDGIEFFGGNVNVKYAVLTEGGDDGLDWDEGYNGKVQYVYLKHGAGFGEDNGIEASNQAANQDALPRAMPSVANLTMVGNGTAAGNTSNDGVRFKEGTGGRIWNSAFVGFKASCLNLVNTATFTAAGTPPTLNGTLILNNSLVNCTANFKQDAGAPFTAQAFYSAGNANLTADPLLNNYIPGAGSPLIGSGNPLVVDKAGVADAFFDSTNYIGAFRDANDDWTRGWTYPNSL